MVEIYKKALKDAQSHQMLSLLFLPLIAGILVAYFSFDCIGGSLITWLESLVEKQNFHEWIASILHVIIDILTILGATIWLVLVVVILQLFMGVFYAPFVVSYVHKHYFNELVIPNEESTLDSLLEFAKLFGKFLLLLFVCLPLLFIPIVGAIAWILLFFWFFSRSMMLDVAGAIFTKNERIELEVLEYWELKKFMAGIYLMGLIPFANLFIPVFQILCLSHFLLEKRQKLLAKAKSTKHHI